MEDDALLTPTEAAELLRMTVAGLAQLRYRGGGPAFQRLTAKTIVYKRSACLDWVESRTYERTDRPVAEVS